MLVSACKIGPERRSLRASLGRVPRRISFGFGGNYPFEPGGARRLTGAPASGARFGRAISLVALRWGCFEGLRSPR